jgi:diguanylate cyclase (GGDEF)-like protein
MSNKRRSGLHCAIRTGDLRRLGKLIPLVAAVFAFLSSASSSEPAALTSLRAVHELSNAEASHAIPVYFEATVTYFRGYDNLLFVEDQGAAIFVRPSANAKLIPGDRILVRGVTQESFRPLVLASSVTLLYHGTLPQPIRAGFDELIGAQHDCMLVTVHAMVRAADLVLSSATRISNIRLQLVTDGGHIEADLDSHDERLLADLLGAEVQVTGVESGEFDNKMQQTAVKIHVSTLADFKVLKRVAVSPWLLPVTPIDQILRTYHVEDLTQRVRVRGTITYYQPGAAIVVQDGAKSLWIATHTLAPLRIGDVADVTGFPDQHDFLLTLIDGEVEDSLVRAPVTPLQATWQQLAFWNINKPNGHQFDLVSIEGQVVTEVREAARDEYVLNADGKIFTAIYRHPSATDQQLPMMRVPLGSRIRVTGICVMVDSNTFNKGQDVPFDILMRSFDDISVVAGPSLLNIRNLMFLVGLLLVAVGTVSARGWTLERRVRRQTAAMAARVDADAALERRRSTILEAINGSQPLSEILEQIAELVSFVLDGAPCWCQITDGAQFGNCPPDANSLRIAMTKIPARSGPDLGAIFVGFDRQSARVETEALAMGTRLASLAIEARRLYSDLQHRSEFDLLTEIHNRFSLDRFLDAQIAKARQNAEIFGLIYIDLDKFKQVNDHYGHLVGDIYLREVALRMKRQLRSHDMLARLGGDEFAVLVPLVRSRVEVEEIAQRLERSFLDPFNLEGYVLQGSASIGFALYPEDGATRDYLLNAADASMYVTKQTKREMNEMIGQTRGPDLTAKFRA